MKACTKCGTTKPKTEFNKCAGQRDGLQSYCRVCSRAANAAWSASNPEKARARSARWYAANHEKAKAYSAKQYADNPDKAKAAAAAWQAANPESVRIKKQNRRAKKRAAGGKLSKGLTERLFVLQRGKCACGCKQPLGNDYHLDHRMPLALGGVNEDWNIQLLRGTCNMQKSAKHPVDFMQQRGFLI